MKRVKPKNLGCISDEWDKVSPVRQRVIDENKDISLINITAPAILEEVAKTLPNTILDVGCGTGYLTHRMANYTKKCIGIDASKNSIALARARYSANNLLFFHSAIEEIELGMQFDLCVANMVFSCDPTWIASVKHIYDLLNPNGRLLVMLPHPCFWASYWRIREEPWFSYNEELYIEHDFSISCAKDLGRATYIHRPISTYINGLISCGFVIAELQELAGDNVNPYHFFLLIKCTKCKNTENG